MRILLLGRQSSALNEFLQASGDDLLFSQDDPLRLAFLDEAKPDFVVSYGYGHLLRMDVLARFLPNRAVNLHIGYLPWNRGTYPNLWACLDGTPSGATIHYLDPGMDTGDVIAQQELSFSAQETLRSAYLVLHAATELLFMRHWRAIREGTCPRLPQPEHGTAHRDADMRRVFPLLPRGWDTPLADVQNLAPQAIRPVS